ncbi:MAG: phage tail family protein [Streptococcaceae bacterium]|jgi:predicted phage tail component-like protein|nr:phage tail family protein [Streptococcaceae bacterium]
MDVKFSVIFNDFEFGQILDVTSLERGLKIGLNSRTENRNNRKGVNFLGTESTLVTIPMDFIMVSDILEKRRQATKALNVSEPCQLIFGDEPDKYYLARPSGDVDFNDLRIEGTGSITWEIYDGVAYSVEPYNVSNKNESGQLLDYIEIDNPGTEPIQLTLEATFKSDCGFLGLENSDGSTKVLFGNIEEADGHTYLKSEQLISTTNFSDWETWNKNTQDLNKKCSLSLNTTSDSSGIMLGELSGNMGTSGDATGGCKRIVIPEDSNGVVGAKNFYIWARSWFETSQMGQTVATNFNFVATDGTLIASYIIEKVDKNGNTAKVNMVTGEAPTSAKKSIEFTPAYWISANPYTSRQANGGGPWDLKKEGGKITFYWYGAYFPFNVPSLADKELGWIEFYVGQWNGRPLNKSVNGLVAGSHLRYLSMKKLNVDAWKNDPNKFSKGDVLKYGQIGRNIYATYNDLQGLNLRDPASTKITAPPGKSVLYIAYSSFATTPEIKLTGRAEFV